MQPLLCFLNTTVLKPMLKSVDKKIDEIATMLDEKSSIEESVTIQE
jgi:F0F1-type ATP synthase membrane subunit b/b'